MDTKTAGAGAAAVTKRPWVCECDLGMGWRPYGMSRYDTLEAVRRVWRATTWRHGAIPRARARHAVTGELVAL